VGLATCGAAAASNFPYEKLIEKLCTSELALKGLQPKNLHLLCCTWVFGGERKFLVATQRAAQCHGNRELSLFGMWRMQSSVSSSIPPLKRWPKGSCPASPSARSQAPHPAPICIMDLTTISWQLQLLLSMT